MSELTYLGGTSFVHGAERRPRRSWPADLARVLFRPHGDTRYYLGEIRGGAILRVHPYRANDGEPPAILPAADVAGWRPIEAAP